MVKQGEIVGRDDLFQVEADISVPNEIQFRKFNERQTDFAISCIASALIAKSG